MPRHSHSSKEENDGFVKFFKSTVHQSDKNLQSEHMFNMVLDTLCATFFHLHLHSSVPCLLSQETDLYRPYGLSCALFPAGFVQWAASARDQNDNFSQLLPQLFSFRLVKADCIPLLKVTALSTQLSLSLGSGKHIFCSPSQDCGW